LLLGHLLYSILGVIGQRDRPRAKSSTITAKEMADTTTELKYPVLTNHVLGVRVPIVQFIDELERKHNPESSLHTIVRSNAVRFSHLTQRTLNAANTRSTNSNPLRKLAKASDRQYRKHQAEVMKIQVHEYLNSQSTNVPGRQGNSVERAYAHSQFLRRRYLVLEELIPSTAILLA
jgi:hypothetical protein